MYLSSSLINLLGSNRLSGLTNILGGGDDDPKKGKKASTYQTQAEVDAANARARDFAKRRNYGSKGIDPNETFVAKRPGDPVVPFVDPQGNPYNGPPYNGKVAYTLPSGIKMEDIKSDGTFFWYDDPHTGDFASYIHPSVINQQRFRVPLVAFNKGGVK
jgi:hypothetical protein